LDRSMPNLPYCLKSRIPGNSHQLEMRGKAYHINPLGTIELQPSE